MAVSYKKLWKKLIDLDLKKKDLEEKAGISHYAMLKLNKGENVTTEVLGNPMIIVVKNAINNDLFELFKGEAGIFTIVPCPSLLEVGFNYSFSFKYRFVEFLNTIEELLDNRFQIWSVWVQINH